MATKTPVSILRELCVKKCIEETYSMVSSYGPPNDPTFEMSVETNTGLKGVGKGKKKKEAQHNAAQDLLDQMKAKGLPVSEIETKRTFALPPVPVGPQSPVVLSDTPAAIVTEKIIADNAVGCLQEYCQARNWAMPKYSCLSWEGNPHQSTFTMLCEVGNSSAKGVARTKQEAKQLAARALYQNIVSNPSVPTSASVVQPFHALAPPPTFPPPPKMTASEMEKVVEKYALCKPLTEIPTTKPNLKFGSYHTCMQDVLSKVRADLDKQTFSCCVKTLKSIAEKLDVRISYHEGRVISPEDAQDKKLFAYVIVTTEPTTVQVGDGDSVYAAMEQAAHNVLRYWQNFLGIFHFPLTS